METQILLRPVFMDEQQRATLCCPQCGRSKVADVTRYIQATKPPKVKCACGHRFRVPLAPSLSTRYACKSCSGTGSLLLEQGKKVTISASGYCYQTLHRKSPCPVCNGLGLCLPSVASAGWSAAPRQALTSLASRALASLEWIAMKLGVPAMALRRWLEMDVYVLGSLDLAVLCKRKTATR